MGEKFEHIIEENKDRIYRLCRIYAVSPVEPKDLFQEVIYQAWKSFPSFKGNASVSTWMYRIALNVCLRSKMKFSKSDEQKVTLDAIQFIASDDHFEMDDKEKYAALQSCIGSLNEIDKSIVVLYLDELPYKEIGEITGLSANHIAVKMKRIKKGLFDCITQKL